VLKKCSPAPLWAGTSAWAPHKGGALQQTPGIAAFFNSPTGAVYLQQAWRRILRLTAGRKDPGIHVTGTACIGMIMLVGPSGGCPPDGRGERNRCPAFCPALSEWKAKTGNYVESCPTLGGGNGTVYVESHDGRLYAVSPSGNVLVNLG